MKTYAKPLELLVKRRVAKLDQESEYLAAIDLVKDLVAHLGKLMIARLGGNGSVNLARLLWIG